MHAHYQQALRKTLLKLEIDHYYQPLLMHCKVTTFFFHFELEWEHQQLDSLAKIVCIIFRKFKLQILTDAKIFTLFFKYSKLGSDAPDTHDARQTFSPPTVQLSLLGIFIKICKYTIVF